MRLPVSEEFFPAQHYLQQGVPPTLCPTWIISVAAPEDFIRMSMDNVGFSSQSVPSMARPLLSVSILGCQQLFSGSSTL